MMVYTKNYVCEKPHLLNISLSMINRYIVIFPGIEGFSFTITHEIVYIYYPRRKFVLFEVGTTLLKLYNLISMLLRYSGSK